MRSNLWAIILAAGDGRRLESVTADAFGHPVPKQFVRFDGRQSLLERTLERANRLVPTGRTVPIVARAHREWWQHDLAAVPARNVVVQPQNRGTAAGILLPLCHVVSADPDATVVVFPSDHHVEDEPRFAESVADAVRAIEAHPEQVILLGITPDRPDPEYGWILPAEPVLDAGLPSRAPRPVARFVEKPFAIEAAELMQRGALWNSFVFVARASTLLAMFEARLPFLAGEMAASHRDPSALEALYQRLDVRDFSREVLQQSADALRVLRVPACGWTDLGTPDRLAQVYGATPARQFAAA